MKNNPKFAIIILMKVVKGQQIANKIYQRIKIKVASLAKHKVIPCLAVILVGDDQPSLAYVKKKEQAAKAVGIKFILKKYASSISEKKLIAEINKIQNPKNKLSGLIIQLPLPKKFNTGKILESIDPKYDVDCLTQKSLGKLITGSYTLTPPSAGAILEILKDNKINLSGKNICLVGAGYLIGRPLANILIHQQATITVCNSFTKQLKKYTKNADIIITGVGKHNLITGSLIKKGATVIDAGVCFVDHKMYGDIDFAAVSKNAKLVTPTPGGVGPITVAKLMENTVINALKI